jgi:NAD(P)-dependent dehydrogenase (short-subunit alcohol dehydrogenase family)
MVQAGDSSYGTLGPLLTDKVAVVTGGAGAIGNAICRLYAAHGADVVVADKDANRTQGTVNGVAALGRRAIPVVADLTKREGINQLKDAALGTFGRVDILVNGLGEHLSMSGPFENWTEEQWQAQYEMNLLHVFRASQAFIPSMKERGWGRIVNFSSVEGIRGMARLVPYTAFKGAVNSFTKSLGVELADTGIRVNCIAVDMTKAYQLGFYKEPPEPDRPVPPLIPAARWGEPEDVAKAALFLASDLASWVVGDILLADGGSIAAGGWHRPPGGWFQPQSG